MDNDVNSCLLATTFCVSLAEPEKGKTDVAKLGMKMWKLNLLQLWNFLTHQWIRSICHKFQIQTIKVNHCLLCKRGFGISKARLCMSCTSFLYLLGFMCHLIFHLRLRQSLSLRREHFVHLAWTWASLFVRNAHGCVLKIMTRCQHRSHQM